MSARYTVVIRATECQFRIPTDGGLLVEPIQSDYGPYSLRIVTRTDTDPKFQTPIPRELWIEVIGPAPNLESALRIAASAANEFVRQVAFAANAWQGVLGVHLGFESTPGQRERSFLQNWTVDERGLPRPTRQIDPKLVLRFLIAIARSSDKDKPRLIRAITQYTDALQYWEPGSELYALSHLYMAFEALTPTAIRAEIRRRGMRNRRELERAVLQPPKLGILRRTFGYLYAKTGGFIRPPDLDTWARRELLFRGDEEAFRSARSASDKLEHGLAGHDEVQHLASKCVDKCAQHLRDFVIDTLDLLQEERDCLKASPYQKPAATMGLQRQLHATIVANGDDIAAPDQAYPRVIWAFDLQDLRILGSGALEMKVEQKIIPSIADGAQFRLDRIRLAGPNETTHGDVKVSVERKRQVSTLGGVLLDIDAQPTEHWAKLIGSFVLNVNAIRSLSIHWRIVVGGGKREDIPKFNFRESVDRIATMVSEDRFDEQLRADCIAAWKEALDLDEARQWLAGSAVQPSGLLAVDTIEGTNASILADVSKLAELNGQAVDLAQRLTQLLERAIAARRPPATPNGH